MTDLTPEGLRVRARELVAVEPDGQSWRVVLVCGKQRSSVIRLSEHNACEAYAGWIQDKILLPAFTALVGEAQRAQREEIERLKRCLLDASRFIPGDETININAETNRTILEAYQESKLRA